jgi:hypothetical protein
MTFALHFHEMTAGSPALRRTSFETVFQRASGKFMRTAEFSDHKGDKDK